MVGKNTFGKKRILPQTRDRSEALLNFLLREVKDNAIFEINPKGIILSWNFGAERMKQFTAAEAVGQNYAMLYRDVDRKNGRPQRNIVLAIQRGRHEEEWWRRKKDGTFFWANAVLTPIYSSSGELLSLSKIVIDLTAKKATENALRHANDAADSASRLKSVFIANLSHEIRTPLGAILGFSEVLKDTECSVQNRLVAAEVIDRSGKNLLRIIEDILDISKIDAGNLETEVSEIFLIKLLQEVVKFFEPKAHDKGLMLKIMTDADVPEIINSDPKRLRQILCNIIGNAVKFTDKGNITITVKKRSAGDEMTYIEFIVTDTGIGLSGDERKNLFMPFAQADRTLTRKFGGPGLGLALSRKLAETLGGDLSLSNADDSGGCSFKITIANMNAAYLEETVNTVSNSSIRNLPQVKKPCFAGTKVLVVDDSSDNRLLLNTLLSKWGIETDFSKNGLEAVEKASQSEYDLILMDIQMPIMDGNEATRILRRSAYTAPIVAVTAHTMNEEKAKAYDAGCDDYLVKPIHIPKLLEILEKYARH